LKILLAFQTETIAFSLKPLILLSLSNTSLPPGVALFSSSSRGADRGRIPLPPLVIFFFVLPSSSLYDLYLASTAHREALKMPPVIEVDAVEGLAMEGRVPISLPLFPGSISRAAFPRIGIR